MKKLACALALTMTATTMLAGCGSKTGEKADSSNTTAGSGTTEAKAAGTTGASQEKT